MSRVKGALANETLYSAEKAKGEGYIPFKSSDAKIQDVTKYGGFTSVTGAYFFLVEHDEKKKRIRTIESVPLYLADRIDKDSSELERYCDKLGLVNYDIMKLYCRSVFDALNDGDISLIKFYKNEL